jgi:23S rRNA pseudouridine1911/1915/1917 synthase
VKVQFQASRERVLKQYQAIAWGWPERDAFRVELPLALDPASSTRVKMRVARPGHGLASATAFEVLGRRAHPATGRQYTLLACTLETGRQHQIRVHLAAAGLPLVGDKLYGPDEALFGRGADGALTEDDRRALELDRHALHAALLELDHPVRSGRVRVESPFAADLQAFWDGLSA